MRVQHLLALVTCGSLSLQPAFAAEKTSIDKGEGAVDIVAWPGLHRARRDKQGP